MHQTRRLLVTPFALLVFVAIPVPTFAQQRPPAQRSGFREQVDTHFKEWDKDRDGTLSSKEIDEAVTNAKYKSKAAAALAALKQADRNKKLQLPPLTWDYLKAAGPSRPAGPAGGAGGTQPDFDRYYNGALQRITSARRELFVSGVPRLETIHQGRLGDCFCLAPLGAMIHRDANAVAKMFRKLPDHAYQVTFGNGRTVRVDPLTDAEIGLTSTTEQDGLWVNVYESALGELRNEKLSDDKKKESASDLIASGGSTRSILEVLTGRVVKRMNTKPRANDTRTQDEVTRELRQTLSQAIKDKRLVCTGTPREVKVPGVHPSHAYAVLDFIASRDEVLLWNPHGQRFRPKGPAGLEFGYPTEDGKFRVPLREFVQIFGGITYETAESVKPAAK
jgi:hypothetical protein